MKKFKNLMFIVAVLCLCCGLLAGCGSDDPGEENPAESGATKTDVPTGDYLADKYNLDTDEITIYCWDKAEPLVVITDPADIEALQDSVDFASWEYVPSEEGYDGIEEYYVHFNDDVFIGVYRDIPYGFIAK